MWIDNIVRNGWAQYFKELLSFLWFTTWGIPAERYMYDRSLWDPTLWRTRAWGSAASNTQCAAYSIIHCCVTFWGGRESKSSSKAGKATWFKWLCMWGCVHHRRDWVPDRINILVHWNPGLWVSLGSHFDGSRARLLQIPCGGSFRQCLQMVGSFHKILRTF